MCWTRPDQAGQYEKNDCVNTSRISQLKFCFLFSWHACITVMLSVETLLLLQKFSLCHCCSRWHSADWTLHPLCSLSSLPQGCLGGDFVWVYFYSNWIEPVTMLLFSAGCFCKEGMECTPRFNSKHGINCFAAFLVSFISHQLYKHTGVCTERQIWRTAELKCAEEHPVGGSNNSDLTCWELWRWQSSFAARGACVQ